MSRDAHPLARILDHAADGRFPAADGGVDVLAPDEDGTRAVVALTGHAYVLADESGGKAVFIDSGAPLEPLHDFVERGAMFVRSGQKAFVADGDQARIRLRQRRIVEPVLVHRVRFEIFEHDVGAGR